MTFFGPARSLRILFIFQDPGRIRYFEGPLEVMARRGHHVTIAVERPRERIPGQWRFAQALTERYPNVRIDKPPKKSADGWRELRVALRRALDYLHYQQPHFDRAPEFRSRARRDTSSLVTRLHDLPLVRSRVGTALLQRGLARLEQAIPPRAEYMRFIEGLRPDAVLVTPLVWFGSSQTDWIRASQRLGVHAVGCVFSWDNLTSKGSIRDMPDLLTVWNETQKREAADLHRVPPERIVVTGAQNWDHWFEWAPVRTRAELCGELGVPADRPIVLYLQSSGYVGSEGPFLRRWLRLLRSRPAPAGTAAVIVRPHPQVQEPGWADAALDQDPASAVFPVVGAAPIDEASRRDFFDTVYHADAVVGVNTSAFIEAAIVGRPCLTVLDEEFQIGQTGTVHFHYLREENGGPVRSAGDLLEHMDQLASVLDESAAAAGTAFVESFVRPYGREVAASPRVVAAVEYLCFEGRRGPVEERPGDRALRAGLTRLATR